MCKAELIQAAKLYLQHFEKFGHRATAKARFFVVNFSCSDNLASIIIFKGGKVGFVELK